MAVRAASESQIEIAAKTAEIGECIVLSVVKGAPDIGDGYLRRSGRGRSDDTKKC